MRTFKCLTFLITSTFLLFSVIVAFKQPTKTKPKLAPNKCTASNIFGAQCDVECPTGQTPSCTSSLLFVSCTCLSTEKKGDLSLHEEQKYDDVIAACIDYSSINSLAFASVLSDNKDAVIKNDWTEFNQTAETAENIYYNVLTDTERGIVNAIIE